MNSRFQQVALLPTGRVLMIHPAYVHYATTPAGFLADEASFLPVSQLYAGELIERAQTASVAYFDCQLHDLAEKKNLQTFDSFGISVMGAQDIAAALVVFRHLINDGIPPSRIYLGGQGVEPLTPEEYQAVFPGSNQVSRASLSSMPGYMKVVLDKQIDKLPADDLRTYLGHELTLLLSQGCMYGCSFCGAQTGRGEAFYNTKDNLEYLMRRARDFGINRLQFYCTSLDFFQQALPGQCLGSLTRTLEQIIDLKGRFGLDLEIRALTRANSYNAAVTSAEILSLVKEAGFRKFGFGADGAASLELLKAMRRGTSTLKSDLIQAFEHAENNGLIPEMLYVFGVPEDTEDTLRQTRDFLIGLLDAFPNSQYRGFPAKNEIPGNSNWAKERWCTSAAYRRLFADPALFLDLGFETLANAISHQDEAKRRLVNRYAIEMSLIAHRYDRVQSYLTVPIMLADGHELMDAQAFDWFLEIIERYVGGAAGSMKLENLADYRHEINKFIPKDR